MAKTRLQQLMDESLPAGAQAGDLPPSSPSLVSQQDPFLLDFELLNGNHIALPYSSLLFLSFNPSAEIAMMFATHTVRVAGFNLRAVYEGLVLKSVGTLKAVRLNLKGVPEGIPIISKIEIEER